MTYSQVEVNILLEENQKDIFAQLENESRKCRRILQKKGKLLSYGGHLHIIPKHRFRKLKQSLKIARGEE